MKLASVISGVLIATVLSLGLSVDAQAKRLGGGKSFGKQSYSQNQAAPSQNMAKPSAPAPTGQSRFGSMGGILGGIAAGVGLSMLLSHFGLGEAAANFFSTALIVMAIAMIGLWLIRKFFGQQLKPAYSSPSGVNSTNNATFRVQPEAVSSASTQLDNAAWPDQDVFLQQAKKHFVQLQEASDKQDLEVLKEFTSPGLFEELRADLLSREGAYASTQVLTLNAELLSAQTDQYEYFASVKFSGLIREEKDAPAVTFEEIWNWTKPLNNNTGWVLAGIQQIA